MSNIFMKWFRRWSFQRVFVQEEAQSLLMSPSLQRSSPPVSRSSVLPGVLSPEQLSPSLLSEPLPSLHVERRFRDDVPYVLPKDFDEEKRLDFQHYALRYALKGNFFAPLQQAPQSILDVGCGSGIWTEEMGQQFPEAKVVGFDLEAPSKPGRYTFVQGNILQCLPFPDNSFDFVHQRLLIGAIPAADWPRVVQELRRVTMPGGGIELVESSGTGISPAGPNTHEMTEGVIKIAARRGINTRITEMLDQLLQEAGLANVCKYEFPVPVGNWGGRLGSLMLADMSAIIHSFKDAFIAVLGYTPEQFDHFADNVVQEWERYHSQYAFYCAIGQKK